MDVLAEFIFQAICFPIGWPLMKALTLGKYPVKGSWFSVSPSAQWTSAIGLAVLVIAMMAALRQFVLA
nr:hypothetical protein [Pseudomonas sp. NFACC13-1]